MDKTSKTIFGGLGLILVAGVVYSLQPSGDPKKSGTKKPPLPSVGGAKSPTLGGKAVTADYIAPGEENLHFDRLSTTPKNGFRPIIERRTLGRGAGGAAQMPNAVPTEFSGEAGWVYTGTAAIDDHPSALFENKSKNEAEYVTVGQKWKKCTIQSITSTTVTLLGQGGHTHVVDLLADPPQSAKAAPVNSTVPPSNMPLGISPMLGTLPSVPGGMTFTMGPDGSLTAAPAATPNAAAPAATNNGGGGRRRGGRRGGGGGGAAPDQSNLPSAPQAQFVRESLPDTPIEN